MTVHAFYPLTDAGEADAGAPDVKVISATQPACVTEDPLKRLAPIH